MNHWTKENREDQEQTSSEMIGEVEELRRRIALLEARMAQQKKSEEALRSSEERFQVLFETLPLGVVYQNRHGEIIRANPAAERILGLTLDQLLGRASVDPLWRALHEDGSDFPGETHPAIKALETGEEVKNVIMGVYHPATKDYVWINIHAVPQFRTGEDRPGQVYSIFEEITEKKRTQDEIKKLARFPGENPNSVMRIQKDGTLLYHNQASEALLRHWKKETGSQVPKELDKAIKEVLSSRTSRQWEDRIQDRTFSFTVAAVTEEACVNVYGLEITELKRVEENLKREKERFRILVDASPLGVSLMGPDGRCKYINPKFTAIFGYTLEDIPDGRAWFRKAYPDEAYRHEVIAQWLKDLRDFPSGESRPRTFKVICKDGEEKVVHFSPVSMETGDQLVIYEDITDRKKLEIQLIQAQKMEAVGTLAGGIAHDFNNLLMAIQGNVSLMLMDLPSPHPDRERLQHIESCVRSGADLTKQLLGFARRGKYQVKATDLNDLIDKASALFGRTQKGLRIHRKLAQRVWTVEVDRGQMEQVLLNLLVNAWQAMPQGGDLYLETQNVFLDEHYVQPFEVKLGHYVKTSVTDTGIGMDEETKQRIFEPFFTTKERGRGTGLGLATVYGIIKGHEGFITVYSEPGRGTTFNFYIPASAKLAEEEKKEQATLMTGQEGILLVDDEEIILQVAAQLLERLGYTVFVAHNGREALDLYSQKAKEIDLVILDLVMPGMGGGETFQNLKKLNPKVKVLLSSGYSINGLAREIMDQGCRGFIQKPFNLKEVSVIIREILDQEDSG